MDMMTKNKNLSFLLMGIGSFMIFTGFVSSFIIGLNTDRAVVRARMVDVNHTFEEFSTQVSIYEEQRDLLYEKNLSNFYYDKMFQEDAMVKNKLSNHEAIVDTITKKTKQLDTLCDEVYYPDSSVNSKCINYKSIYEQVNNYFVTDINYYNKNVESYNTYTSSHGGKNLLKEYQTKKKYIDYNNDKKQDGREE